MSTKLDYGEVLAFMKEFGCDFINRDNELIIDLDTNTYVGLDGIEDKETLETTVVFALCRPIGKGLDKRPAEMLLYRVNKYFGVKLNREDMRLMYRELCYMHKVNEFKDFVKRGFPTGELFRLEEV